jgi:FkbM family methyltransferase
MGLRSRLGRVGERVMARMPVSIRLDDKLVLVDVGASGGLQRKWERYHRSLVPVLFEPNPAEAASLRAQLGFYPTAYVIDQGLSDRAGPHTLNVAHYFGCTSLLEANMTFLKDYAIAGLYERERTVEVSCTRYDALVEAGKAPKPDVIKIDIEGFESRALAGFGDLLADVLGIETEAWFYPAYQGQALLHDLVDQLDAFGLRLRRLEQIPGFEGDLVSVNAFFSLDRGRTERLPPARRAKFNLMAKVWGLPPRS